MANKKCSFLFMVALVWCAQVHAQRIESAFRSDFDYLDDENLLYRRELVYGINLNTNGGLIGGLMIKHARVISRFMFHSFSLEMVNVKHPKENRVSNLTTGRTFVEEKQNYLFTVRPMYGREIVLFQKAKVQGIQVNWIFAAGPTFGVVAPYLINFRDSQGVIRTQQFNPDVHRRGSIDILGTGSFLESLSQAKIEPGASLKMSVSFEFGAFKTNVTGFETGFMVDQFLNEIVIIPRAENRSLYTSAFLTFYYGFRK
jgi:hypothetical protein